MSSTLGSIPLPIQHLCGFATIAPSRPFGAKRRSKEIANAERQLGPLCSENYLGLQRSKPREGEVALKRHRLRRHDLRRHHVTGQLARHAGATRLGGPTDGTSG